VHAPACDFFVLAVRRRLTVLASVCLMQGCTGSALAGREAAGVPG
jgi:hypothetical protein